MPTKSKGMGSGPYCSEFQKYNQIIKIGELQIKQIEADTKKMKVILQLQSNQKFNKNSTQWKGSGKSTGKGSGKGTGKGSGKSSGKGKWKDYGTEPK